MDVGLIAGQIDRRARGAGRRHRQHERRASRGERQRRAPFERERKRARPRQQRRVRVAVRDAAGAAGLPALASISVAPDSRLHAVDAGAQHVAGQR